MYALKSESLAALLVGVYVCLVISSLPAESFEIKDCTPHGKEVLAKLDSVSISDCNPESDLACKLVRGRNASIDLSLTALSTFKEAKITIYGKFSSFLTPFRTMPVCGLNGFVCPVEPNEQRVVNMTLPVLKIYPKLSLHVQLAMMDEQKRPIVCIDFPAEIVDPAH